MAENNVRERGSHDSYRALMALVRNLDFILSMKKIHC